MEHFAPAVQLGLTATPKRDVNGDTYAYFGEPVYEYSLKAGINDGFLSPFRLKEIHTTIDEYVYTPDDDVEEGVDELLEVSAQRALPWRVGGAAVEWRAQAGSSEGEGRSGARRLGCRPPHAKQAE